ncbi:MAG: putative zinc-binding metallopeptidase [Opitutae bacterium]
MRISLLILTVLLAAGGASGSALFDELKQDYQDRGGVELATGHEPFPVALAAGSITGKNVPNSDIDIYLFLFRKEFGKYPGDLFGLAGLKRVVFCRELGLSGQARAAIGDSETGTLYLDVRSAVYSESYRRKTIHHEFYHLIDTASRDTPGDADWVALNPKGFVYGSATPITPGDNKGAQLTHPAPGFVTGYAMTALAEDKAEIFANLMVNDLKLRLLLKQDEFLQTKVARLKKTLQEFCPKADAAFWANVAKQF